jgi:hypothetical protein
MGVRCAVDDVAGLKGALLPVIPTTNPRTLEPVVRSGQGGGGWRRLVKRGLLGPIAVGLLLMGSAPPAVAGDTCTNAAARSDNASTKLPDCRGYEMVTPPYKEGFPALLVTGPNKTLNTLFTDDGIVEYGSTGNFAGNSRGVLINEYRAKRSAAGWMTTALSVPETIYDTVGAGALARSVDLRWSLTVAKRRALPGDTLGFWLRGPDGGLARVGDATDTVGERAFVGGAYDLSHIVYSHGTQGTGLTQLYEYVGTGNGPAARAVTVDNHGQSLPDRICATEVSDDARVIVFNSGCVPSGFSQQVWARVAGSASVAVSGSECTRGAQDPGGVCNGVSDAAYAGKAVDGSRVFFTTSQQLVNGDTDAGNDLYACDIPAGAPAPVGVGNPCETLTEVSGVTNDARVENVVSVSQDGSQVYFVARGVLADNLGVGEVGASDGAPNLYLWERDGAHPAGQMRFVTHLNSCAVPGDCNDLTQAQMTPDGRYLLFLTANQLVTGGPGADTDDAVDAYRYDAASKAIVRVSMSVAGGGGNALGAGVSLTLASSMTADGSTVIFDSPEALSADDVDGVTDVYSWRDGQVSLISTGGGSSVGITPSGRDIFFATDMPVLAADGDPNIDVYDARVGGGFAVSQPVPCSGDGCQGQRSQPPLVAGPSAAAPGSVFGIEAPPALSLRAVSAAQRKALAASGKVSLVVTANAPGTITARATAALGGRSVAIGSGRRSLTVPGRTTVILTLSKRGRAQLAARGRLSVRVAVSHSKVALDRTVTLRLVHAKSKAKRSARQVQVHRAAAASAGSRS